MGGGDHRGICFSVAGCALLGPLSGPNLKLGGGFEVRREGQGIVVRKPFVRVGLAFAGFFFYLDVSLRGHGAHALAGRVASFKGRSVMAFLYRRWLWGRDADEPPQLSC